MANVTDPLAAAVHGTDPQNLMEYIVRQKIYDSRYWKEECFGLTAVGVLEKATKLTCVGASFGGNRQPTKFLCLVLKLLQLSPDQELIDEFISSEEFKYVRALGAFYKRLSGRPAEIYESLEQLYTDYSKLRYRDISEWKLMYMDEFVHSLLHDDRVCGIALPRLPQRRILEEEGYLEDPYRSALRSVIDEEHQGNAEEYLHHKVKMGSEAAKELWQERQARKKQKDEERQRMEQIRKEAAEIMQNPSRRGRMRDRGDLDERRGHYGPPIVETEESRRRGDDHEQRAAVDNEERPRKKSRSSDDRKYGSLFKSSSSSKSKHRDREEGEQEEAPAAQSNVEENTEEYWNEQRAKLGLKPLKK